MAAKAWFPAPKCCRSPHFSRESTRRRFRASDRNAWARRSWRSAASTTRRSALREPVLQPDALIIQDSTLLHQVDLFNGLPARGYVLLNSTHSIDELGLGGFARGVQQVSAVHAPRHRARAQACRPRRPECGAARRLCRDHRRDRAGLASSPRSGRNFLLRSPRRMSPPRRKRSSSRARRGRRSMLKQTEGSHAVAEAVALCRPQVICAYPITPQTHIVEGLGEMVKAGELAELRVHQRRIGVRRDVGGHRRVGGRRAHLHGHQQPGAPVHGGSRLQRRRARTADRDDHRQSRDRRADQHLERPFRQHVDARRRLDPAVRRNQSGSAGPAHPGVSAGRGAVLSGDGLHGRLHPDPRV